jgi:hypothetical protein
MKPANAPFNAKQAPKFAPTAIPITIAECRQVPDPRPVEHWKFGWSMIRMNRIVIGWLLTRIHPTAERSVERKTMRNGELEMVFCEKTVDAVKAQAETHPVLSSAATRMN